MTKKDKTYELILKNLTNEISKEEQILLEKELSKDKSLRKLYVCYSSLGKIVNFYGQINNYFTCSIFFAVLPY